VLDATDDCPNTVTPEKVAPTIGLEVNHWALTDSDNIFDTLQPNGVSPERFYTTEDTRGCSCEQIIEQLHLGKGHEQFGCSIGVMDGWVKGK
jgi:hypothetical protein